MKSQVIKKHKKLGLFAFHILNKINVRLPNSVMNPFLPHSSLRYKDQNSFRVSIRESPASSKLIYERNMVIFNFGTLNSNFH